MRVDSSEQHKLLFRASTEGSKSQAEVLEYTSHTLNILTKRYI
jgi:hypothetical protein